MYITYISHSTTAKNNLEKDFEKYLLEIERTLVNDEEVSEFKKSILNKYEELCKLHSRCKPIPKYWGNGWGNKQDFQLHRSNINFYLLKSK